MYLNTSFDKYRKKKGIRRSGAINPALSGSDSPPSSAASSSSSIDHPEQTRFSIPSSCKVQYRKRTTKKLKTWEFDGTFHYNRKSNKAVVKNEDFEVVLTIDQADKKILKSTFSARSYDVKFDADEFDDGPQMLLLNKTVSKPVIPFKPPKRTNISLNSNTVQTNIVNINRNKPQLSLNSSKGSDSANHVVQPLLKKQKKMADNSPIYDVSKIDNPLFMPDPIPSIDESEKIRKVVIDPSISSKLRPHQRDGVKFLYSCLMGFKGDDISGAILADEMGLGKTLQTITLIWTLLRQSPIIDTKPVIDKVLVCCPVSLVNNWKNEFNKWLGMNRVNVLTINNNKFTNEKQDVELFGKNKVYQVMIIGYEKMQSMSSLLSQIRFDLLVCDEGHRLKNSDNKTMKTLENFNIRRRILLTGTPIQNDLVEFYTMVNFTNPGILKDLKSFQKEFIKPILNARDSNCSNANLIKKGSEKSKALVELTNNFILRRSNSELTKYLPKRSDYIILVPPTPLQMQLFKTIIETKRFKNFLELDSEFETQDSTSKNTGGAISFNLINVFRKICNSPSLLKDDSFFLELCNKNSSSPDDVSFRNQLSKKIKSGKLLALIKLLGLLHSAENEKVVIVSNFTATLDIIESIFKSLNLVFLRLDGSVQSNERTKIVDKFNKSKADQVFALLLSAKAGGVGLNLIGASRLVLYDNDWNPAIDLQAIARIHRDGQKKEVKIYRFLTNGCIDEKIFQRQLVKQDLSDRFVDQKGGEKELFDRNDLKDIFNVQFDKLENMYYCNTHELMGCECQGDGDIMIEGKFYNDSCSDMENNENNENNDNKETENQKNELLTFVSALDFSKTCPQDEDNSSNLLSTSKKRKIRRCMKGYRHINPGYFSAIEKGEITDDSILDTIINDQTKENPLISYIFGKF